MDDPAVLAHREEADVVGEVGGDREDGDAREGAEGALEGVDIVPLTVVPGDRAHGGCTSRGPRGGGLREGDRRRQLRDLRAAVPKLSVTAFLTVYFLELTH